MSLFNSEEDKEAFRKAMDDYFLKYFLKRATEQRQAQIGDIVRGPDGGWEVKEVKAVHDSVEVVMEKKDANDLLHRVMELDELAGYF